LTSPDGDQEQKKPFNGPNLAWGDADLAKIECYSNHIFGGWTALFLPLRGGGEVRQVGVCSGNLSHFGFKPGL
jgi:hypothetical protein